MNLLTLNNKKQKCARCGKTPKWLKGKSKNKYCPECHVVEFFERELIHTKGKWAGCQFKLLPWQLNDVIIPAFGTLKADGRRQYRFVYVEVPKKNGKSELASGIAIYGLVGDGEMGAEVYSASNDREQASLVYNPAEYMVYNSPHLSKRLRPIPSRKRIIDHATNSFYQVLSSESFTKHGLNPHLVIYDEIHASPNRELYDVLTDGTDAAREQQLVFIITTAGIDDHNSIGYELKEKARQVRDGIIEDPEFLPVIYAIEDEEDWEDPEVWKKCNPSFGHIFDLEKFEGAYRDALIYPEKKVNFQRLRLNKWVGQISRWIPMEDWDACEKPFDKESLITRKCFGGLDLSSIEDLTAFILVFPPVEENEDWKVLCKFYVPEENIFQRQQKDRVPYDLWARAGHLIKTSGSRIDYEYIRRDVINTSKIYNLVEVAYDPWNATTIATKLAEEDGIEMLEHRQGFKSMSPPLKELLSKIKGHELAHNGHPVLRWNADNFVVKVDESENVRPAKNKARERIDGIVALAMAYGRAAYDFQKNKSVYETRGLVVL